MQTKRPPARLASFRGFTLIELLTVIAIIGVLAAIIIPTVGAVRKTAQRATCAANMRDVGTAILSYASENRELLPGPTMHSMNNTYSLTSSGAYDLQDSAPTLANHLARYLKLPPPPPGETRYAPPFLCPAWHSAVGGKPANDNSFRNETWRPSDLFGKRGNDSSPYRSPQRMTMIENPSRTVALRELDADNHNKDRLAKNYHGNHTHTFLFFDGHVEFRKFAPKP